MSKRTYQAFHATDRAFYYNHNNMEDTSDVNHAVDSRIGTKLKEFDHEHDIDLDELAEQVAPLIDTDTGPDEDLDETLAEIDDALARLAEAIETIDDTSEIGEWLDLNADTNDGNQGVSTGQGVAIAPKRDLAGLEVRLSENSEATTVELVAVDSDADDGSGDILETLDTAAVDGDGQASLSADLTPDLEYNVLAHADGDRYQRGRADDVEFPVENDDLEVLTGVYSANNNRTAAYRYNIGALAARY